MGIRGRGSSMARHLRLKRVMKVKKSSNNPFTKQQGQSGKVGWILLWLVGIPVPILLGLFFLRGCT